jgi:uncharacterized membrane protein
MKTQSTHQCSVCKKQFKLSELTPAEFLSEYLIELIKTANPQWGPNDLICRNDLNHFRTLYVNKAIQDDIGEISALEDEVSKSIKEQELIADNLNTEFDQNLNFGDRLSDKIASFGGSWKFIILFSIVLFSWILINSVRNFTNFDPYPFILLNLVLSFVAALQAPVIMMSQNRQESKDRLRAEMDYKVNLKAELEIRHLKAKLDQLASHQWRRLLEVQEMQTQLMEEISQATKKSAPQK